MRLMSAALILESNMNTVLAITLGHNSSATLIWDGQIICGYEQERFSTVKSDSQFPRDAINEINRLHPLPPDTTVCVGHWFLDHNLPEPNKYWDPEFLRQMMPDCELVSLDREFSHHDSHLEAAMVFAGPTFAESYHAFVVDGFGSSGECFSIYKVGEGGYKLLKRVFGFEKSLGMLYQYATAFLGMKMHNHEYKMLAYEVHIHSLNYDMSVLKETVYETAKMWIDVIFNGPIKVETDALLSLTALPKVQSNIDEILAEVLSIMGASDAPLHDKRCIISYFVQHVVEKVMCSMMTHFAPENLLLSGGLFYNVKLNGILTDLTPGKTCIMPIAGDQGCALGVYNRYFGDLKWPGHLYWGERDLSFTGSDPQMVVVNNDCQAQALIAAELERVGFVNVVRGAMEFGPRALCHTSTLAIPRMINGAVINHINDRTNEMPFALVMSEEQAAELFVDVHKVHKSLEYMICTRVFKPGKEVGLLGGAHYYPDTRLYTCRPQITKDPMILALVDAYGPLINTSYNFHGVPIVLGETQIKATHFLQQKQAPSATFKTIIVRN